MNTIATNPENPLKYWLALLRTPGLGCRTILKLLDSHKPEQIFAESTSALTALGLKSAVVEAIQRTDWSVIDQDLDWLSQPGNLAITLDSPDYPARLKEIADPPPVLFVRGDASLLTKPQIAIVGSRNPSKLGLATARGFAQSLAQCGLVITSGLALGIDAASHQGALDVTAGTIAVAGTGPDRVYPASHKTLAEAIIKAGAIVSELPPGTTAKAANFPRRNRIISGLSMGLLVVEAARQSGSLITARLALEQNREVFAIPGSIHNPLARGCNALIREGAKLVETTQDILEELNLYFPDNQQDNLTNSADFQSTLDLEQQTLLNLILFDSTSIDDLVGQTGSAVENIASMLLVLELHGYIEAVAGGCYRRMR